jgi:hypothetical protein
MDEVEMVIHRRHGLGRRCAVTERQFPQAARHLVGNPQGLDHRSIRVPLHTPSTVVRATGHETRVGQGRRQTDVVIARCASPGYVMFHHVRIQNF